MRGRPRNASLRQRALLWVGVPAHVVDPGTVAHPSRQRIGRVQGVFQGFATIGVIIALGALLAHLRIVEESAQLMLSRLAFFVASPALMVVVLGGTDISTVFSRNLAATIAGVAVTGTAYAALARFVWRRRLGHAVIGTFAAAYVNAGNLGIPIAAYVLGDAALVAPTLLLQLVVLQPLGLALLDHETREGAFSLRHAVLRPLTNPLTIASVLGVVLSATTTTLPRAIYDPLELIGNMAVPSMLIAYGVSLRLGPRFGAGAGSEVAAITALKLVVQPLVTWLVAGQLLGLSGHALLAVTVTAALPTAQNIFTHAVRYGRGQVLARDAILATTVGAVPVILGIAAVLS